MKRSREKAGLLPTSGLGDLRRPHNLRQSSKTDSAKVENRWFRIENAADAPAVADVYIYDEIGYWGTTASDFVAAVASLDVNEMNIHINSPGGEVFDGVAIYNAIRSHKAYVTVFVDGLAASAASFIAQAGDEVVMRRGTSMMIHDAATIAWGNSEEFKTVAKTLDSISNNIADIYAQRTGGTTEAWRAEMRKEVWYTAQEAVDAGLADRVDDAVEKKDDKSPEDRWDLSVFNYAGRAAAPAPQTVPVNGTKESSVSKPIQIPTPATPEVVVPEVTNVVAEEAPVAPVVAPVAPVENVAPVDAEGVTNAAQFGVVVNGVLTSDIKAIQKHINTLETFASETKTAGRAEFLNTLAREGKIAAPQAEALGDFVQGLTDEQYATWSASMSVAPQMSLFGKHTGETDTGAVSNDAEHIETLRGIVKHHRDSGRSEEFIASTSSYKELMALEAKQS